MVKAIKADYAGLRQQAEQMPPGLALPFNKAKALQVTPEERQRECESRWARGGIAFSGAFSDLLLDHEANDTAAEFVRAKIRQTVRDPKVAELFALA
jgi:cyclohexanone monooxygenase